MKPTVEVTATFKTGAACTGNTIRYLIVILLLASAVRGCLLYKMPIVSRDGVTFIRYAQQLQIDGIEEMRRQDQHPLYPILLAVTQSGMRILGIGVHDPVRQWIIAGQIISITFSLLVILAVYSLTALLFGGRQAVIAALFAALLPEFARYGVDVLSDSLHLSLYIAALAAGLYGFLRNRLYAFGVAGILSGLAFLVRPEGAEAAIIIGLACIVLPQPLFRRRIASAVLCGMAFIAISGPYMWTTGRLVQKKSIQRFILNELPEHTAVAAAGIDTLCPPSLAASLDATAFVEPLKALGIVLLSWIRCLRVMYLLPVLALIVLRRRIVIPGRGPLLIAGVCVLHVCVCVLLIVRFEYWKIFALRHVLILAALTLPFSAAGLVLLADTLKTRRVSLILLLILTGPTLPWLLRTPNTEHAYLRRASDWIRDAHPTAHCMITNELRVPYYAGGAECRRVFSNRWSSWSGGSDVSDLEGWILGEKPGLVILDERPLLLKNPRFFSDLKRQAIDKGLLREIHTVDSVDTRNPMRIRIYAVQITTP